MAPFTDFRDNRIDPKHRVVIPALYARTIQEESGGVLYLVPARDVACLQAIPARLFEGIADAKAEEAKDIEGSLQGLRRFFGLSARVEIKGPGRITIPQRFLEYFPAGVVRVVGVSNYLELWDPALWEQEVGATVLRAGSKGGGNG